jgi:hypothetical protein
MKEVEKAQEKVKAVANAAGKEAEEEGDDTKLLEKASVAAQSTLNMITLYTLLTLLRNPQIRSASSIQERAWLKQVYDSFNLEDTELMCLSKYLDEAASILGASQIKSVGETDAAAKAKSGGSVGSGAGGDVGRGTGRGAGRRGAGRGAGRARGRGRARGKKEADTRSNAEEDDDDDDDDDDSDALEPPTKKTKK